MESVMVFKNRMIYLRVIYIPSAFWNGKTISTTYSGNKLLFGFHGSFEVGRVIKPYNEEAINRDKKMIRTV